MKLNIFYDKTKDKDLIKSNTKFDKTELSLALLLTLPFILMAEISKTISPSDSIVAFSFIKTTLVYSVFLFVIGYRINDNSMSAKELVSRGLRYLCIGLFINIVCGFGVQFFGRLSASPLNLSASGFVAVAGSLFVTCALIHFAFAVFKKLNLKPLIILIISFVMVIITSALVCFYTENYVINQLLSYFIPSASMGFFPLFSCMIFAAFGYVYSHIQKFIKNLDNFYLAAFVVSMFVLTIFVIITLVFIANKISTEYVDLSATSLMGRTRYKMTLGLFWPDALFCVLDLFFMFIWFAALRFITRFFNDKIKKFINNITKNFEPLFVLAFAIGAVFSFVFVLIKVQHFPSVANLLVSLAIFIVALIVFRKFGQNSSHNNKFVNFCRKHYVKILVVLAIIAIAMFIYALCCTAQAYVVYSPEHMQNLVNNFMSM